jgi:hypothetical protein
MTHDEEARRKVIVDVMSEFGVEVFATTAIPLTDSEYDYNPMSCPHGSVFYMQPTNDQILRWRQEQVR